MIQHIMTIKRIGVVLTNFLQLSDRINDNGISILSRQVNIPSHNEKNSKQPT
ncbi:MAG: hypothetical protein GX937_04355 [Lentisphaerae bacterium]|nr:hypothetical protein [Lentisphaerota bacterium]